MPNCPEMKYNMWCNPGTKILIHPHEVEKLLNNWGLAVLSGNKTGSEIAGYFHGTQGYLRGTVSSCNRKNDKTIRNPWTVDVSPQGGIAEYFDYFNASNLCGLNLTPYQFEWISKNGKTNFENGKPFLDFDAQDYGATEKPIIIADNIIEVLCYRQFQNQGKPVNKNCTGAWSMVVAEMSFIVKKYPDLIDIDIKNYNQAVAQGKGKEFMFNGCFGCRIQLLHSKPRYEGPKPVTVTYGDGELIIGSESGAVIDEKLNETILVVPENSSTKTKTIIPVLGLPDQIVVSILSSNQNPLSAAPNYLPTAKVPPSKNYIPIPPYQTLKN